MKYSDGSPLRIGDHIELSDGLVGIVVFNNATGEYSPEYPESEWGYLSPGVMVDTTEAGLVYYTEGLQAAAAKVGAKP